MIRERNGKKASKEKQLGEKRSLAEGSGIEGPGEKKKKKKKQNKKTKIRSIKPGEN